MSKINVLPEDVYLKIAAGEVVERPANIVKELVENSIDARAEHVDIRVEDGGRQLIEIADDGEGISPDDLTVAVMPHATSKIMTDDDLQSIMSYGFRGEALASVAAVSRMVITSCPTADGNGRKLEVHSGDLGAVACRRGTTVSVRSLFYNTPARLKFLRKNITETNLIHETVALLALANPGIGFKLFIDGVMAFQTFKGCGRKDIIRGYYDETLAAKLIPFDREIGDADSGAASSGGMVSGYVSQLDVSLATRSSQFIFVNGRPINDKKISYTLFEAYKNYFLSRRHPYLFLFIDLVPGLVDVNVHPQKKEVRFARPDVILSAVYAAVQQALRGFGGGQLAAATSTSPPRSSASRPMPLSETARPMERDRGVKPAVQMPVFDNREAETDRARIIGSYRKCYILAEGDGALLLFDQHVLSERINFNRIMNQVSGQAVTTQNLLIPYTVALAKNRITEIRHDFPVLQSLGFTIEDFGGDTIIIQAVPSFLGRRIADKNLVVDIINDLAERRQDVYHDRIRDIAAMIACRAAVKAGDYLSELEMRELVNQVYRLQGDDGFICPHGRPAFIAVDNADLEKWFSRK